MRRTDIDGVPAFIADAPLPVSAGLVFGVGRRDESFVRGGLTHLVEHLAMHAVGRLTIDANASVGLDTTEFTAIGPADQVSAFLLKVCQVLSDLPVDRLAVEADILRTEGSQPTSPLAAAVLAELYGLSGLGLAAVREPALRSLTADDVRSWVRRYFGRANAALWTSAELPGLRLPLPASVAPERAPQYRIDARRPVVAEGQFDGGVAVGAEVPVGPALRLTVDVLRERIEEELRHRRGIAYSVQSDRLPVDADRRVVLVTSDVRAGHEGVAAELLWREVQRLADEGPTDDELTYQRALVESYVGDPRAAIDQVRSQAECLLIGVPVLSDEELRRAAQTLTATEVQQTARAIRDSAVLVVPESAWALPGLPRGEQWSTDVVAGRTFERRHLSEAPRGARLVVGPDGVTLLLDRSRRITVRYADVAGMVRTGPQEWLLFGRDGFTIPLTASDWRDGKEALAAVRAAVRDDLQVVDDDVDEGGLLLFRAPAHSVREAIAMSKTGAAIASSAEWTAVVSDGDRSVEEIVEDLSPTIGRGTVAMVLRRSHADLEYVLLQGAKEIGRHRWGVTAGDPTVLAGAAARSVEQTAWLHSLVGEPTDILPHVVGVLGLPPQVPALLAGEPAEGLERAEGLGLMGGFRVSVRGEYERSTVTTGLLGRWNAARRTRPAWFRVLHAAGAVVFGLLLWLVLTSDSLFAGDEFRRVWVSVMLAIGVVTSLMRVRPPDRPDAEEERVPQDVTPTG